MIESDLKFFSGMDEKNQLWVNCKKFIQEFCVNDLLYKNYLDLDNKKLLFFNGIIHKNNIISFGGIEYSPSKWGIEIARVLTRFWIHPEYRSQGLTKWSTNKLRFSPIILTKQLEFLKTQPQIKAVMITREGPYDKSFLKIIELASTVSMSPFEIVPGLHKLDRKPDSDEFQMIALSSLTNESQIEIFHKAKKLGFFKSYE